MKPSASKHGDLSQDQILERFQKFLKSEGLKFTSQRRRIFDRIYATEEHFTAEQLYSWLREESGPSVSRATVYRTLGLLVVAGFLDSLDTGHGELRYEHVHAQEHHDHLICLDCGSIEEFLEPSIEALQEQVCWERGFHLVSHRLQLKGYCKGCARERGLVRQ